MGTRALFSIIHSPSVFIYYIKSKFCTHNQGIRDVQSWPTFFLSFALRQFFFFVMVILALKANLADSKKKSAGELPPVRIENLSQSDVLICELTWYTSVCLTDRHCLHFMYQHTLEKLYVYMSIPNT